MICNKKTAPRTWIKKPSADVPVGMGLSEHSKGKRSVLCHCRQASCLAVLMGWNLLKEEIICYYICCPSLYFTSCQKRLASKAALWDQILILSLTDTVCVCVCEVTQSCPILCDPKDCSPPGTPVHGILQARMEWVALPFSRGFSWPRDRTWVSCIAGRFFTLWATREAHCSRNAANYLSLCGSVSSSVKQVPIS